MALCDLRPIEPLPLPLSFVRCALVMKPLGGKTDFQGLYSLISFRYEAKGFRAELILIAGRFA
jgi:hypothetical protein